ncbi:glycosyltransferase family 32 protein [Ancylobacter sp.]|uniref:glycosyltransferase family 32 protein n=1 Tax=Ancylobacter sp. TaxID=1872567 RepID=UPI003C7BF9A7
MPGETETTIPKIIHTCWFGGAKKPRKLAHFERVRRQILSDYQHFEWTENNIDIHQFSFLEKCFRSGNYAHVSDMVRLLKIYEFGGVYMDTDVEVLQEFAPLLSNEMFLGYMWDCNMGTAVIGARPQHPIIMDLMKIYIDRPDDISTDIPNNDLMTEILIAKVEGFVLDGRAWRGKNITIYEKTIFEHPSFLRRQNYTIHHFNASWKAEWRAKAAVKDLIARVPLGLYLYRKYICAKAIGLSPFKRVYDEARTRAAPLAPRSHEEGGSPRR